ncbi:MAG: hypothetical protein V5A58_06720 [Salinibacter sp.]|uniref:hypothetical protein n=2 Tax=Salinibacter sp. TaxID=2065818 RepID=UPI002FC33E9F
MGQQQLLLLVLATVIVGLATVAGIQAFEQGSVRANQDALTQTAVKIASDIQAKAKEPSQFGGYDGNLSSGTPSASGNVTLSSLGYETSSAIYETSDGECKITTGGGASSSGSLTNGSEVSGVSGSIKVTCTSQENSVTAGISSLDPSGITSDAEVN